MGNHEHLMMRFLADPDEAGPWLANGGDATLASYGVAVGGSTGGGLGMSLGWPPRSRFGTLRDALAGSLPVHHRRFLDTLATSQRAGDYLFVHAGIRPGVPMDDQDPQDLIWIRGPFLRATEAHGCLVVHGHSIRPAADRQSNRIGIDTGAYYTGRLTALAIDGARARLLTACGDADLSWIGAERGM
jgi:serine/threonine protein phosphatase 1